MEGINLTKPIVVLDAGHGGKDSGAVGNGLAEKNIVLSIGLRVGKLLEDAGFDVRYTRKTDTFVSLSERARLANAWDAALFVSLHVNSAANNTALGFESFVYNGTISAKTSEYQTKIHRKIAEVFKESGSVDRGQKRANFAVLRETKMPAILIEYGFVNNPNEAALLRDEAFIERLARATAEGIAECFGVSLTQKTKEQSHMLSPEDANKIIATWLGPAWNFSQSEADKTELNRLANELRKASGQKTV